MRCVLAAVQGHGGIDEMVRSPYEQEGDHGTFAATQVQAVIPVGSQAPGNPVDAYLAVGKIQDGFHMLPNGAFSFVCIGDNLIKEGKIAALPDVFHDGRDQPEGIVRAGIADAVEHPFLIRLRDHGRGFDGTVVLCFEHSGIEQVEPVTFPHLSAEELADPHHAAVRLPVGNAHGVLRGIPVTQSRTSADLDKGRETGEEDVDLTLVEVPDIEGTIHVLVRGMDLQGGELFLPEVPQACESTVRAGFVILLPGLFCGVLPAGAQIKEDAFFLAGAEDQLFPQRSADVAAKLRAAGENTLFDGGRVAFGPVGADEGFPDAVMPVRLEIAGEELVGTGFVVQFVQAGVTAVMGTGGV